MALTFFILRFPYVVGLSCWFKQYLINAMPQLTGDLTIPSIIQHYKSSRS